MGERGPKPQPSIIQIAKGDPGGRAEKRYKNEPKPPAERLECPGYLDGVAQDEWRRVIEMFERVGQKVITEADVSTLEAYCIAYSRMVKAYAMIEKHGDVLTFEKKDGTKYVQQSPYVAILNKSIDAVKKFAAEFGFTPASRGRVQLPNSGKKQKSEEEEMFGFD